MSTKDNRDRNLLIRALKQEPDEFLAAHISELRELRDSVERDDLVSAIDAVIADVEAQEGSS